MPISNAGHVSGKVAVVTGGARGMGAAYVRALAREGVIVAATDIIDDLGASPAEQLQAEGRDVSYYHYDVTSRAGWEVVVASVQQAHGPIDVLVNNAGVQIRSVGIEADDREWHPVTDVNQRGVFLGMRAPDAVHALKKQITLGRDGRAGEISAGVVFLASDESSFTTGVALPIDGGMVIA